jgi:hypothetical protein
MGLGRDLRIKDQLRQALTVSQIEEDQVTVIPIRLHPTGQHHLLASIRQPKLAARMRSLQHS